MLTIFGRGVRYSVHFGVSYTSDEFDRNGRTVLTISSRFQVLLSCDFTKRNDSSLIRYLVLSKEMFNNSWSLKTHLMVVASLYLEKKYTTK